MPTRSRSFPVFGPKVPLPGHIEQQKCKRASQACTGTAARRDSPVRNSAPLDLPGGHARRALREPALKELGAGSKPRRPSPQRKKGQGTDAAALSSLIRGLSDHRRSCTRGQSISGTTSGPPAGLLEFGDHSVDSFQSLHKAVRTGLAGHCITATQHQDVTKACVTKVRRRSGSAFVIENCQTSFVTFQTVPYSLLISSCKGNNLRTDCAFSVAARI